MSFDADVIIVGAGPAGMSAALVLGRACRTVLMFDHGRPRNAATQAMHGFLTRDGIAPAEFRRISREQLTRYENVRLESATVSAVSCREDGGFTVTRRRRPDVRGSKTPPRDRRRRQRSRHSGARGLVRAQRVSLPVLRRLGAPRQDAGGIRPRTARFRPLDGTSWLVEGHRALHRRTERNRRRGSGDVGPSTASASGKNE